MSNAILLTVNGFNTEGTMGISAEIIGASVDEIENIPIGQLDISHSLLYGCFQYELDPQNPITQYKFLMNDMSDVIIPTDATFDLSGVFQGEVEGSFTNALQNENEDGSGCPYPTPVGGVRIIEHDFVRHLAKELFQTTLGADLFANEQPLRTELERMSRTAMTDRLGYLVGLGQLGGVYTPLEDNVSKIIYDQILAIAIERIANLTPDHAGGNWYNVPLRIGDVLSFKFNIKPAPGQHGVNSSAPVDDREYEILVRLV